MVRVVQQTRNPDRANHLMCPHDCDINNPHHHDKCVWRPAGSRVQAVPRGETNGDRK